MQNTSNVGLIGLATMGANYARNLANTGLQVSVFNRTYSVTQQFIADYGNTNLIGYETIPEFIASLQVPRSIILLVKAGQAVDQTIEQLLPHLSPGDILIDCGNSHFADTARREVYVKEHGIAYMGCGISGGEHGALVGPSIMPGGSKEAWSVVEPLLKATAAKDFDGKPCISFVGPGGAGHYVKMVHNGIEYAIMQLMAEAYMILRNGYKLSAPQIADIFEQYNNGRLRSFLFEISLPILRHHENTDSYVIDYILDSAQQKGTGQWTALESLQQGVPLSIITEAVYARSMSSQKNERVRLEEVFGTIDQQYSLPLEEMISALESAFYASIILSYTQGIEMIRHMSTASKWNVDTSEMVRIWQGGCIIRADLLRILHVALQDSTASVMHSPAVLTALQETVPVLRLVVRHAVENGTPIPCFMAAIGYFDTMKTARGSANFLQALRDSFGAHTYERIDQPGTFHTQW
jgi:6-phosphogluconate dehydrogenase